MPHHTHRKFAIIAAVIGWLAIMLQMGLTVRNSLVAGHGIAHGLVMFLGFFTVTTNIFIALVLTAHAVGSNAPAWAFLRRPVVVTCATACMITVGITYFFLLRRLWNPQGLQYFVDVTLHYVMPILTAAFWWMAVAPRAVAWSGVGSMLIYPTAYLLYVFARAPLVGSYPYYFIDANTLGLGRALLNAAAMTAFFLLVLALLIVVSKGRASPRH